MITVENDWIEYAPVPARRAAVRGGAVCAQRVPVARAGRPSAVRPVPVASRAVVAHRAAPTAQPRLRLTRRGRIVLVVLPAVLGLSSAFVGVSAPFAAQADTTSSRSVVVGTGDTLWSVAERVAPTRDPRDVVAELEQANGLQGAAVDAGARLTVPADLAR